MMLKIDILVNVPMNDCMLITYAIENSKDFSNAKFDSNCAYFGLDYLYWVVIHIFPLHWLE